MHNQGPNSSRKRQSWQALAAFVSFATIAVAHSPGVHADNGDINGLPQNATQVLNGANVTVPSPAKVEQAARITAGVSTACSECFPNFWSPSTNLNPQEHWWTCGPSSSRFIMWRKEGFDRGESAFYNGEGESATDPNHNGTSNEAIAYTINSYLKGDGYSGSNLYGVQKVSDPNDLMSYIVTDSYYYNEALIQNVLANDLSNWTGAPKTTPFLHFDSLYGYSYSANQVLLAEEYDRKSLGFFSSSSAWNPYGYYFVDKTNDFAALANGPSQSIVW